MSEAPPLKNRPTWYAATTVEPNAKVSGSTSVACWLVVFLNGSALTWVSGTLARAGAATASKATATNPASNQAGRTDVPTMLSTILPTAVTQRIGLRHRAFHSPPGEPPMPFVARQVSTTSVPPRSPVAVSLCAVRHHSAIDNPVASVGAPSPARPDSMRACQGLRLGAVSRADRAPRRRGGFGAGHGAELHPSLAAS